MRTWGIAAAVALAASALAVGAGRAAEGLNVGDKAPDFKLVGTDGHTYTLSHYKGKSWVVIAWYPKALTGG